MKKFLKAQGFKIKNFNYKIESHEYIMNRTQNLVVTLSDENYLQRSKQLFSSIYYNSGWKGDFMLLVNNVPERKIKWFKQRGILIEKCRLLLNKKLGDYSPLLGSKIYLFQEKFKKWKNIIYLDSDIIVRGSLNKLTEISGFAAVPENNHRPLSEQFGKFDNISFKDYRSLIRNLKKTHDFSMPSFNAGVFSFNTKIIKKNTFADFKKVLLKFGKISKYGDQGVQNIFFYGSWQPLPEVYNLFPGYFMHKYSVPHKKIKGIIIHFADTGAHSKPWNNKNLFHREWMNNLKNAENITDFKKLKTLNTGWQKLFFNKDIEFRYLLQKLCRIKLA